MIDKWWMTGLKINLPVTISSFLIYHLMKPIIENQVFVKENPLIVLFILIIVVNFATIILVTQKRRVSLKKISKNEISKNVVGGTISLKADNINNNKIINNTVEKDLLIGTDSNE